MNDLRAKLDVLNSYSSLLIHKTIFSNELHDFPPINTSENQDNNIGS